MPIRRGVEVTGFAQDDAGVDVHLAEGEPLRTAYLVGADGGRSVIRKAAGIDFVGAEATRSHLIAEVEVTEETPTGIRLDEVGIHAMNVMEDGRTVGIVVTEQQLGPATEPTLADLSEALTAVYGTDFGIHDPTWISRFTDATRQAAAYRSGRVLLAGDAAHIHPPTGGQGIGLGVQDAVNLGWKLAQVVQGVSPDGLLDTYQAERHPATARVLKNVMVQAAPPAGGRADRGDCATRSPTCWASTDPRPAGRAPVRARRRATTSARGTRCSDAACRTSTSPPPTARGGSSSCSTTPGRCCSTSASPAASTSPRGRTASGTSTPSYTGTWELPVIGTVAAPAAVLVRPDGHVAWVGDGTQDRAQRGPDDLVRPLVAGETAGQSGVRAGRAGYDVLAERPDEADRVARAGASRAPRRRRRRRARASPRRTRRRRPGPARRDRCRARSDGSRRTAGPRARTTRAARRACARPRRGRRRAPAKTLQASAYFATRRSVFFSPPPPTMIGGCGCAAAAVS